jgi:hypothetical protein
MIIQGRIDCHLNAMYPNIKFTGKDKINSMRGLS